MFSLKFNLIFLAFLTFVQSHEISIPFGDDLIQAGFEIFGNRINFTVTGKTAGYVGFGFSNVTGMQMSDSIMGGVNDTDDQLYFGDYFSESNGRPSLDATQNWDLISGNQFSNSTLNLTTIKFSRLLNTGDNAADVPIENKDMIIIWAIGDTDTLNRHSSRGQVSFNIIGASEGGHQTTTPPRQTTIADNNADKAKLSLISLFSFILLRLLTA